MQILELYVSQYFVDENPGQNTEEKGEQERDKEAAESAIHKEKGKDNSCNTCFKWVVVGAEEWCWGSKEPHDKGKNASYK